MRLLVLMNMYPPYSDGGYPLLCREAVEDLSRRGHDVLVLTSNMGCHGRRVREGAICRIFEYCPDNTRNELKSGSIGDLYRWYRREWVEHRLLHLALREFCPDAIFVWATKGLSHSIPIALQRTGLPFLGYVCGYWLNHHNSEAPDRRQFQFWRWSRAKGTLPFLKATAKRYLERHFPVDYAPLRFDALAYNSEPMREAIAPLQASVSTPVQIVDSSSMDRFAALPQRSLASPFKLLFVGRFHPTKDPLTLIRAIGLLQSRADAIPLQLTLRGWPHDPAYLAELEAAIARLPSANAVRIESPVDFADMPALFSRHHVLVVPSVTDPLPRVAAEAMAAGLVCMVSDRTGISRLVVDGKEALVFPAADPERLADAIHRVLTTPQLAATLQAGGRRRSIAYFSTARMVDEMETFLANGLAVSRSRRQRGDAPADRTPAPSAT